VNYAIAFDLVVQVLEAVAVAGDGEPGFRSLW